MTLGTRLTFVQVLPGVALAITVLGCSGRDAARSTPLTDAQVNLIGAEAPRDIVQFYADVIIDANERQLQVLQDHHDRGVALAAAWESVRQATIDDEASSGTPVDDEAVDDFLRLLANRVGSTPPAWESSVRAGRLNNASFVVFPLDRPASDNMERRNDQVVVTHGDEWWRPPTTGDHAAVAVADSIVYIAIYTDFAIERFPIYALDRTSGELLFSNEVWANSISPAASGWVVHAVDLQVEPAELVIYGMNSYAAYIEAFDLATGENLYRFSTAYADYAAIERVE